MTNTNLLNKTVKTTDGRTGRIYDITKDSKIAYLQTEEDIYQIKTTDIAEVIEEPKTTEETITEIFNTYFTNIEDYNNSDISAIMVDELLNKLNITTDDLNINKLTRTDKENITGYDYRKDKITTDVLERYFAEETKGYILDDIFNTLAKGKSITRKYNKWFA